MLRITHSNLFKNQILVTIIVEEKNPFHCQEALIISLELEKKLKTIVYK